MNDRELQELADLWQEPTVEPAEDVAELARRARRNAVLMGRVDALWGVIIVGAVGAGAFLRPSVPVVIGAVLTTVILLWVNWKRRKFRQMTQTLGTGDRDDFLEASIRLARTAVRRANLNLLGFPPGILAALLYRVSTRGEIQHPLLAIAHWATSLRGIAALILLALLALWMLRTRRRHKNELRRLEETRAAYAEEAARDQEDGG